MGLSCVGYGFFIPKIGENYVYMTTGTILSMGRTSSFTIIYSRLSKLVKETEVGQLFVILSCANGIFLIILSTTINQIYILTWDWFPGAGLVVLLVLQTIALFLTAWETILPRTSENEGELVAITGNSS